MVVLAYSFILSKPGQILQPGQQAKFWDCPDQTGTVGNYEICPPIIASIANKIIPYLSSSLRTTSREAPCFLALKPKVWQQQLTRSFSLPGGAIKPVSLCEAGLPACALLLHEDGLGSPWKVFLVITFVPYGVYLTQRQLDEAVQQSSRSATKLIRNVLNFFLYPRGAGKVECLREQKSCSSWRGHSLCMHYNKFKDWSLLI